MKPIFSRSLNGGTQEVYRFENNYGASVIRGGEYAYGGLELAVVKFDGEGDEDYQLCYTTPVTDDVLGYLTDRDVEMHLNSIKNL